MQNFTPFGLLSGALFDLSLLCSFTAIRALDSVAIATGIWCGEAMVTSFVFGALVDSAPQSWPLAALSVLLMVLAVVGITCVFLSSNKAMEHEASSPWCALVLQLHAPGHKCSDGVAIVSIMVLCVIGTEDSERLETITVRNS